MLFLPCRKRADDLPDAMAPEPISATTVPAAAGRPKAGTLAPASGNATGGGAAPGTAGASPGKARFAANCHPQGALYTVVAGVRRQYRGCRLAPASDTWNQPS